PKNPAMRKVIDEQVDELIQAGAIEPSRSPHSPPIVLVKKKTGDWRMCVDNRQLKKTTIRPAGFELETSRSSAAPSTMTPLLEDEREEEEAARVEDDVSDADTEPFPGPGYQRRGDPRTGREYYRSREERPPPKFKHTVHRSSINIAERLDGCVMLMKVEFTTIFVEIPQARGAPPYVEEPQSLPTPPAISGPEDCGAHQSEDEQGETRQVQSPE
ncbi:hypothetical protein AWZ03_015307, partial [Drosophila navojoa]